ncbi:MAG: hypothetical protein ACRYGB_12470 [Janthinobacterium lividum]
MGEVIAEIVMIVMLGYGIYATIANQVDKAKLDNERKKTGSLKFNPFINAVERLFKNVKPHEISIFRCTYKIPITNGVKQIGNFEILVKDDMNEKRNSVGTYKTHSYQIVVACHLNNVITVKRESLFFNEINETLCNQNIQELKKDIEATTRYKDGIQIFKIN